MHLTTDNQALEMMVRFVLADLGVATLGREYDLGVDIIPAWTARQARRVEYAGRDGEGREIC